MFCIYLLPFPVPVKTKMRGHMPRGRPAFLISSPTARTACLASFKLVYIYEDPSDKKGVENPWLRNPDSETNKRKMTQYSETDRITNYLVCKHFMTHAAPSSRVSVITHEALCNTARACTKKLRREEIYKRAQKE